MTCDACHMSTKSTKMPQHSNRLTLPRLRNRRLISQEAVAQLLLTEQTNDMTNYTPSKLCNYGLCPQGFKRYAMPMVHPVTGEIISSYKRLMNNPMTAEVWMMAYGKDFRGMGHGDNMTVQKGTNAMFIMLPSDIPKHPQRQSCYVREGGC
jgi:hypothetical protein